MHNHLREQNWVIIEYTINAQSNLKHMKYHFNAKIGWVHLIMNLHIFGTPNTQLINPISHGIFFSWLPRGVGIPPDGKSTSECLQKKSFLNSHLYIFWQLKSKRRSLYLHNSRDEVRSKFGRKLDKPVENSKIKNLRCGFDGQLFPGVAKN